MPSWVVALTPVWAALGGAVVVGIFRLIERFRGERKSAPPTWPEMWDRIDKLEKAQEAEKERQETRDRAYLSIVTSLADSWPAEAPRPEFDSQAISVLEDTLPPWFMSRHRRPRTSNP